MVVPGVPQPGAAHYDGCVQHFRRRCPRRVRPARRPVVRLGAQVTRFLIRRILQGILVMWLVTVSVFLIFFVGPGAGSVAHRLAGKQATPATVAEVAHRLLLDRPIYVQYGHFLWLLLHGNLGYDFYHSRSEERRVGKERRSRWS